MEIEIRESKMNKRFRMLSKGFCIYLIAFGTFVVIFQLILQKWYLVLLGFLVAAIGYYNKKRIARVTTIKDNSIVLLVGNRKIELNKEDISRIRKWRGQITLSREWFSITISLKERKFGIAKSYVVANEPTYDFFNLFSKMGIRPENFPDKVRNSGR